MPFSPITANAVCYGKYGCFTRDKPFNNFLVWLPQDPSDVGTSFHLYTRNNREISQIIDDNDEGKLKTSNFDISKRTIIVIHGFSGKLSSTPASTCASIALTFLPI
ncbi:MAG: hypothetical protein ACEPO8_11115 [Rhodothermaceae bacterium]